MNKLSLNDSKETIVLKLSEGNPGAISILAQLMRFLETTDENKFNNVFDCILTLDENGIYGDKIWIIYKDVCNQNIDRFISTILNIKEVDIYDA